MSEKRTSGIGKGTPGPGRPKGVPNKMNGDVKAMVVEALNKVGGVDYLVQRALDPKTSGAFLTLVAKVLPMTVAGDSENPLQVVIRRLTANTKD